MKGCMTEPKSPSLVSIQELDSIIQRTSQDWESHFFNTVRNVVPKAIETPLVVIEGADADVMFQKTIPHFANGMYNELWFFQGIVNLNAELGLTIADFPREIHVTSRYVSELELYRGHFVHALMIYLFKGQVFPELPYIWRVFLEEMHPKMLIVKIFDELTEMGVVSPDMNLPREFNYSEFIQGRNSYSDFIDVFKTLMEQYVQILFQGLRASNPVPINDVARRILSIAGSIPLMITMDPVTSRTVFSESPPFMNLLRMSLSYRRISNNFPVKMGVLATRIYDDNKPEQVELAKIVQNVLNDILDGVLTPKQMQALNYAFDENHIIGRSNLYIYSQGKIPDELKSIEHAVVINSPRPSQNLISGVISSIFEEYIQKNVDVYLIGEKSLTTIEAYASSLAGLSTQEIDNLVRMLIKNKDILVSNKKEDLIILYPSEFELGRKRLLEGRPYLEIIEPGYGLDSVAGHEFNKSVIRQHIIAPLKAGAYSLAPLGFMMLGPPGSGKSFSAQAVGYELKPLGYTYVSLNVGRLFGGIVGETEANTDEFIEIVRAIGKVVLFIDEIDATVGSRDGGGDSGVSKRMFGKILAFLGDESIKGKIIVIAASNDPAKIDPAMMSRLSMRLYFDQLPPESLSVMIQGVITRELSNLERIGIIVNVSPSIESIADALVKEKPGLVGRELIEAAKGLIRYSLESSPHEITLTSVKVFSNSISVMRDEEKLNKMRQDGRKYATMLPQGDPTTPKKTGRKKKKKTADKDLSLSL